LLDIYINIFILLILAYFIFCSVSNSAVAGCVCVATKMGGLFSKKEKSRITEQDRAILGLKKQRDQAGLYFFLSQNIQSPPPLLMTTICSIF
jgi:hypothetical protein